MAASLMVEDAKFYIEKCSNSPYTAFLKTVKKLWRLDQTQAFSGAHEHLFRLDRRSLDSTPTTTRDSF
jgi:hypothetical protein